MRSMPNVGEVWERKEEIEQLEYGQTISDPEWEKVVVEDLTPYNSTPQWVYIRSSAGVSDQWHLDLFTIYFKKTGDTPV